MSNQPLKSLATILVCLLMHVPLVRAEDGAGARTSQEAARFCANLGPSAQEARLAAQAKQLKELDEQVRQRLVDLAKVEAQTSEWVHRRDAMLQSATDALTAIYAKMPVDSAAAQLSLMEDGPAVSVIAKLNPRVAGAILSQMDADKASRISTLLLGAGRDKKS